MAEELLSAKSPGRKSAAPRPALEAVTAATLPEFARFLHENLARDRSPAQWEAGLRTPWGAGGPNHGFVLRDGGTIVGGIGAIYADRTVRGQPVRTCNITSWCVLEPFRQQSMRLAMAVIGQPGFHFTDFTPTKLVAGTLQFLKFQPLESSQIVSLNLPRLVQTNGRVVTQPQEIASLLRGTTLREYRDHAGIPWLLHLLVGTEDAWCHVIYKAGRYKGLPSAHVIHRSDGALLGAHFARLTRHLLGAGFATTHVESRLLATRPWPSARREGFNAKQYLSPTLGPGDVDYLYSELTALDLL
jgi:hypothetical protein